MKIVYLISPGDRRAIKKRQSYVRKRTRLGSAGSKILSIHKREIRARCTEGDTDALIVSPYAGEIVTSRDVAFEMVDA
jgi:hypothetical protein